jgi:hypothetical protein
MFPNILSKVEVDTTHRLEVDSYVAFDDVQMVRTDECQFMPEIAWPTTTTISTTIVTEPPGANGFFSLTQ